MQPRNSAGGIIVNTEGKIALVWQNGNSWSFPKGGIDAGESAEQAAWREIREETGLGANDLELIKELGTYERYSIGKDGTGEDTSRPQSKRTMYLFKTAAKAMKPEDKEVSEARFVSVDEGLELLTHPKDKEFLKSVLAIIR